MTLRQRISRLPVILLIALVLGLGLATLDPRSDYLGDYGAFLASGTAINHGLDPYTGEILARWMVISRLGASSPNLNPPIMLPLFAVLALLPPLLSFWLWRLFSALCYGAVIHLLRRRYAPPKCWLVVALMLAGFWYTLALGQVYSVLALIATTAWLLLPRRPVLAGVAIGVLVAVKPNFAIWPLLLLVSGTWLPVLISGIVAAILSLVPALIYGPSIYRLWTHGLASYSGVAEPLNASLPGLLARLGLPWLSLPACCILVAALMLTVWRRRPQVSQVSSLGLVASLVVSPLAWVGYTVMLLPVFWSSRSALAWPAAIMLSVPPLLLWTISRFSSLPASLPYVCGLLMLLVSRYRWCR